ncbi:hypothetical protein H6G36_01165 [Anabaena minutissima FACHB-250]|nr:hypothetical protein [Anabaena minutissima FACHB-250]
MRKENAILCFYLITQHRLNAALPLTPLITHHSARAKRPATANSTQHSALSTQHSISSVATSSPSI